MSMILAKPKCEFNLILGEPSLLEDQLRLMHWFNTNMGWGVKESQLHSSLDHVELEPGQILTFGVYLSEKDGVSSLDRTFIEHLSAIGELLSWFGYKLFCWEKLRSKPELRLANEIDHEPGFYPIIITHNAHFNAQDGHKVSNLISAKALIKREPDRLSASEVLSLLLLNPGLIFNLGVTNDRNIFIPRLTMPGYQVGYRDQVLDIGRHGSKSIGIGVSGVEKRRYDTASPIHRRV